MPESFITSLYNKLRSRDGIVFLLYVACNFLMLICHESWRDEFQSFSIANESHSFAELFQNKVYESHPHLWYIILYAATSITGSPFVAQVIHFIIACIFAWVFLRHFPGKAYIKYPAIFGYFFAYEYSVLFRNYGIEVALAFIFCAYINSKNVLGLALAAFLLLQTNVFGFFLGGCLWLLYLWNYQDWKSVKIWIANTILFAGVIVFVSSVIQPTDSVVHREWNWGPDDLIGGFSVIWNAFIPIPKFIIHFWNSNIIDDLNPVNAFLCRMIGSLIIFMLCLFSLESSKKAVAFFTLCSLAMVAFMGVKYHGFMRHHGQVFLSYIVAVWIKELYPDKEPTQTISPKFLNWVGKPFERLSAFFLPALLVVQLTGTACAYYYDIRYPFSNASAVAAFIRKNKPNSFLMGYEDTSASSVAILLHQKIYYPASGTSGYFILWNAKRVKLSNEELLVIMAQQKLKHNNVVFISSRDIRSELLQANHINLIKRFEPSIVEDEQFFLYE